MKSIITIICLLVLQVSFAGTIVVGPSEVISSLRKAIDKANDGDTILLQKGVYKEGNIVITKSIRLIGVGQPVLDGENKNEILTLAGSSILVKGIQFANAGYSAMNDYAAIKIIDASHVIVENNTITNAYFAIHVANTSYSIIRNNTIKGTPKTEQTTGNGIHLWKCNNMLIRDNHIEGHRDGIYFEFVTHSIIKSNLSTKNIRYGLHFMFSHNDTYVGNTFLDNGAGVAVMYSHDVLMLQNSFDKNWGPSAYGILLKEISNSRIVQNTFHQNTVGIMMEGTSRIDVQMNSFTANGWSMKVQASCDDNSFHHNNFQGNTFDVATNGTMMLNHFYSNYWDKYEGYDLNKDGVGDVSYHPVSMYAMVIEQNPNSLVLLRSFMVSLLDKAEKAIPSLTPENLVDEKPYMKPFQL
ncbi:nitrous oxide reductase family maturation protein NosD [Flavisolibacter tropicus]|uniref:Nitrous oxide reductase n=1 Tax=Flavisolibacter tropicus TaxID=1492898 RepID=A0A172TV69_9BACT|nr:nitrous oxide reductase family maturation protein NosD [Flavisolibacter tropicus]ANE50868.1 nitrous oxide reductase [Flavisolibacter tropicus]